MTQIERNAKGQVVAGSGAALGATSARRLGTSEIARLRRHIEPHREDILNALIATAKGSDSAAVRAASELLDRLAAKPKAQAELVIVAGMKEAPTLQGKMDAVIAAVADGQVSADAGRAVLQMLHAYGRAKSIDDLEARIKALEGREPQPTAPADEAEVV
jgi:hypothetical protein